MQTTFITQMTNVFVHLFCIFCQKKLIYNNLLVISIWIEIKIIIVTYAEGLCGFICLTICHFFPPNKVFKEKKKPFVLQVVILFAS